ncbi:UDP-N-acetylmuramate dehydrogenase [Aerolutibacter ruishenii]|uniref:UDP-N-acetylenolpyruvoylglucosamine reductase n=1 Tax=Aerolutibacter ruishenii TaxID=686800 RepID=A0A562LW69_9GAMM|nr:UDP-N-acetylmuramate dehydrogenase [Lysobacter ruishenii]TWI11885.1 UDP-N-acetylmuramate dehydrogenase [Lysobacter ruishenii]
MTDALRIVRDASLRERNTFGVEAVAPWLVEVADAALLPEVLHRAELAHGLSLVLGGGSNLLFAGNPDGAVLALTGQKVALLESGDTAIVRADAGVQWHDFVMQTLSMGLCGLENLALIPGTVGAAPIQNIGAYGVEVREYVHAVEAFEPASGKVHRFTAAECRFAYRDSLFKHAPDRHLVTAVEFALPRQPALRLDYAGIPEELAAMDVTHPTPAAVARAVIAIRRRKLPDPAVLGNAGSFFKNPIVAAAQAEALKARYEAVPMFHGSGDDTRKLSAAWLIDQCGWKGCREGDAGVAASHALVLVNHGNATGAQLLGLARRIAASVHERFGIDIEPEPRVIGATW